MDARIIRRLAYDGNYQRAIELLCDIIQRQEDKIEELNERLKELKE